MFMPCTISLHFIWIHSQFSLQLWSETWFHLRTWTSYKTAHPFQYYHTKENSQHYHRWNCPLLWLRQFQIHILPPLTFVEPRNKAVTINLEMSYIDFSAVSIHRYTSLLHVPISMQYLKRWILTMMKLYTVYAYQM